MTTKATTAATASDDPAADIVGLTAKRKADRKRIAAAFGHVARKHGATIVATDEPAHPGWSGAAIVLRAAIKSGATAAPSICTALRKSLRSLIEAAAELKAERESIADDFYYWQDGRRLSIEEFAADNV